MKALVIYVYAGELFLFDAAGYGKKLGGPTKPIFGVQYVEAMKGLVTYGYTSELFLFDAAGKGKKLGGPTKRINGVQYVKAMKGLVTCDMLASSSCVTPQALARSCTDPPIL